MAILQISRIQNRRGLQEDLPQLSSAELGWAIDSQKLYIGNGDLSEGAPSEGNTEILTVNSVLGIIGVIQTFTLAALSSNVVGAIGNHISSLNVDYAISNATDQRSGVMKIASNGTTLVYDDEYVETANLGVTLVPVISGLSIVLNYTNANVSTATLNVSTKTLN